MRDEQSKGINVVLSLPHYSKAFTEYTHLHQTKDRLQNKMQFIPLCYGRIVCALLSVWLGIFLTEASKLISTTMMEGCDVRNRAVNLFKLLFKCVALETVFLFFHVLIW